MTQSYDLPLVFHLYKTLIMSDQNYNTRRVPNCIFWFLVPISRNIL